MSFVLEGAFVVHRFLVSGCQRHGLRVRVCVHVIVHVCIYVFLPAYFRTKQGDYQRLCFGPYTSSRG
jgi:hypothetical protein